MITTYKQAKQYGTLVKGNSKIPGSTWSSDPVRCHVGSKLVKVKGSTCSGCYALKLGKLYKSAADSWTSNLDKFRELEKADRLDLWCEAMAHQINHWRSYKEQRGLSGATEHRWFTAGDLDSETMLRAIVRVCELTPETNHWLPTRERAIVSRYKGKLGKIPGNLVIRISATHVDGTPINGHDLTSTVHKNKDAIGYSCPAYDQGGSCGDCRACWSKDVQNVSYKQH